jgi:isoquinoline 1-oxidoreductase beta subunit
MNQQPTFTRRQFLINSLGAGLVLGLRLDSAQNSISSPARLSSGVDATANTSTFKPNVFLSIKADNTITVTVPRAEMGQGVRTSLAMIVAEELDADWAKVRVKQAPASEEYGDQYTGASTSVSTFWQPLREAGAAARAILPQPRRPGR